MQKNKNNLFITLLLYGFTLSSSLCNRWLLHTTEEGSVRKKSMETLKPLEQKWKKISTLPDIVRSHSVNTIDIPLNPKLERGPILPDIIRSHSVNTANILLNPKLERGPILPDIVRSHSVNTANNSQVAKPGEVPQMENNVEIKTVWILAEEASIALNKSEANVLAVQKKSSELLSE